MPPRKRTRQQVAADVELANLPPVPEGYAVLSATEERRERELEEILDQVGTDARIKVWQITDGKSSYAGDMSADGFTLDALLEAFGGGDKTLHIMQGKTRVEKLSVSLDPSIPARNPRAPKAAAGAAPGTMDMNSLIMLMAKGQMDSAQAMTTMMTGMVGAVATMMGASRPTTDPVAQAVQIANVLKQPPNGGGVAEALSLIREGMKIGEQMNGKDDDDGVMTVVSKGMDTLSVLVNGIVEERKAKASASAPRELPAGDRVVSETGAGGGGNNGTTQADTSSVSVRPWVDKVRPNIGQLLAASKFLPPSAAADTIANTLSDDEFDDLLDDIHDQENGGFGGRLKEYFPREIDAVAPEWLGEVLRILLSDYVELDEPAADDPPTSVGSN
jgi:hypothetical protein